MGVECTRLWHQFNITHPTDGMITKAFQQPFLRVSAKLYLWGYLKNNNHHDNLPSFSWTEESLLYQYHSDFELIANGSKSRGVLSQNIDSTDTIIIMITVTEIVGLLTPYATKYGKSGTENKSINKTRESITSNSLALLSMQQSSPKNNRIDPNITMENLSTQRWYNTKTARQK